MPFSNLCMWVHRTGETMDLESDTCIYLPPNDLTVKSLAKNCLDTKIVKYMANSWYLHITTVYIRSDFCNHQAAGKCPRVMIEPVFVPLQTSARKRSSMLSRRNVQSLENN